MLKTSKNKTQALLTSGGLLLTRKGQVILEFTFCMIVILIMMYGVIKVFHWTGRDIVARQRAHETTLFANVSPRKQIDPYGSPPLVGGRIDPDPYFYIPVKMNAVWGGN